MDGKVVDKVFLVITDDESDKCAKLGLKKSELVDKVSGFVENVPAKLDISLEDQNSNLAVVESSCEEVSAITYWFYGKLVMVVLTLAMTLLEPVCYYFMGWKYYCLANDSYAEACRWTIIGIVAIAIAAHPVHIYIWWSGCMRYWLLYLYEVVSTSLSLLSFIGSQFCQEGSNSSCWRTFTLLKTFVQVFPLCVCSLAFDIFAILWFVGRNNLPIVGIAVAQACADLL